MSQNSANPRIGIRLGIAALISIAALLLSGCAVIDKELHNRGGYLDYLADTYWFKADSKKMRALRAFALEASLARIASVSPKSDQDRKLMALRIGDATKRAQLVLQCAFVDNVVPVQSVEQDQCFFFDSLMVDYTSSLFDLALIALPVDDVKNLLSLAPAGIPNPAAALNLLNSLVVLAQDALKYGRLIGAIYRDTVELEVQVWLATPDQPQSQIPPAFQIGTNTVSVLKAVYDRGNDDLATWQAAIAALRAEGLEPIPDPKFIDEISFLIYYMCGQITSDTDTGTLDACRAPWPKGTPTGSWIGARNIKPHQSMLLTRNIPTIKVLAPPPVPPKPAPAKTGSLTPGQKAGPEGASSDIVAAAPDDAAKELVAYYNLDNTRNKRKVKEAISAVLLGDAEVRNLPALKMPWTVERVISQPGYEDVRMKLCQKVLMHACP